MSKRIKALHPVVVFIARGPEHHVIAKAQMSVIPRIGDSVALPEDGFKAGDCASRYVRSVDHVIGEGRHEILITLT